jgi:hypothetical protein
MSDLPFGYAWTRLAGAHASSEPPGCERHARNVGDSLVNFHDTPGRRAGRKAEPATTLQIFTITRRVWAPGPA